MRFDLNRVRIEGQPQRLFDKRPAMRFPVHIGIGSHVRVVVADRAVDFAQKFLRFQLFDLAAQTLQHVGHFLAQRGGRCRLPVRARHHRHFRQFVRHLLQFGGDFVQFRHNHFVTRLPQHERVRQVVDVF